MPSISMASNAISQWTCIPMKRRKRRLGGGRGERGMTRWVGSRAVQAAGWLVRWWHCTVGKETAVFLFYLSFGDHFVPPTAHHHPPPPTLFASSLESRCCSAFLSRGSLMWVGGKGEEFTDPVVPARHAALGRRRSQDGPIRCAVDSQCLSFRSRIVNQR